MQITRRALTLRTVRRDFLQGDLTNRLDAYKGGVSARFSAKIEAGTDCEFVVSISTEELFAMIDKKLSTSIESQEGLAIGRSSIEALKVLLCGADL